MFAPAVLPRLVRACEELTFLRARGYRCDSALELVGNRHQLEARQRTALRRATSAAAGADARRERRVPPEAPPPVALWIDGFNLIISLETALNGGVLVTTLEGSLRDLAGVHGAYRPGPVTRRALELTAEQLAARGWEALPTRWLLDAPVSNTGRLATRIRALAGERRLPWEVEVVPDPDAVLVRPEPGVVVASADAIVLDGCGPWLDLAAETVRAFVPGAWIVTFTSGPGDGDYSPRSSVSSW